MFCCGGSKEDGGSSENAAVERILEESRLKSLVNFKVLLLGAGECGKSTVLKQVKLVHNIQFSADELRHFAVNLRRNTVQSMQTLVEACAAVKPPVPIADPALRTAADKVAAFEFASEQSHLPHDMVTAIQALWASQPIRDVWDRRSEFWCLDSIDYYFDNVERFCEDDFVPDEQDCVMARVITTGIVTTEFDQTPIHYQMIDVGGQRNERRKWIHCFDDVTAIIYLVNLNGYSTVLYEDTSVNRMQEALEVFTSTMNNDIFSNTPIYLLFNKKDLFEQQIRKKPLSTCFPDYNDSDDVMKAMDFVATKFKQRLTTDPRRCKHFPVSARFKKDIKYVWEEIAADLKKRKDKEVDEAVKGLTKLGIPLPGQENSQKHRGDTLVRRMSSKLFGADGGKAGENGVNAQSSATAEAKGAPESSRQQ